MSKKSCRNRRIVLEKCPVTDLKTAVIKIEKIRLPAPNFGGRKIFVPKIKNETKENAPNVQDEVSEETKNYPKNPVVKLEKNGEEKSLKLSKIDLKIEKEIKENFLNVQDEISEDAKNFPKNPADKSEGNGE